MIKREACAVWQVLLRAEQSMLLLRCHAVQLDTLRENRSLLSAQQLPIESSMSLTETPGTARPHTQHRAILGGPAAGN